MASTPTIHNTYCSNCGEALRVNTRTLTVTGGGRAEAVEYDGLIEWECPSCGYADSLDPSFEG